MSDRMDNIKEKKDPAPGSSGRERFGLIGNPLGHSLSPEIHEAIFRLLGLDAEYKLYPLSEDELRRKLPELLRELRGLNITIPYKRDIFSFLEGSDELAARFDSVNTVFEGRGYNTDAAGFLAADMDFKNSKVLILGSGGVSHTMLHCAAAEGAEEIIVRTRSPLKASKWLSEISPLYPGCRLYAAADSGKIEAPVDYILNGTPLGMWPYDSRLPLPRDTYLQFLESGTLKGVFDAIYNPAATRFVLLAQSYGVRAVGGLHMLVRQALEAEKIWHPERRADFESPDFVSGMKAVERQLALYLCEKFPLKIVLTGFMAAGKSTVGERLQKELGGGFGFVDLDQRIAEKEGRSIKDIFAEKGEAYFRRRELETLAEVMQSGQSLIVATGGGALLQDGAEEIVRENGGKIIFLDVSYEEAMKRGARSDERPLLLKPYPETRALYENRRNQYEDMADLRVDADLTVDENVSFIRNCLFL